MAIAWGPANGTYRLGVETWLISQSDWQETWGCRVWFTKFSNTYNANTTLYVSGGFNFSGRVNITAGSTQQLLWEGQNTWNRIPGQTQNIPVSASLTGFHKTVGGVNTSLNVTAQSIYAANRPMNIFAQLRETDVRVHYQISATPQNPAHRIEIWYQDEGKDWALARVHEAVFPDGSQYDHIDVRPPEGVRRRYGISLHNSAGSQGRVETGWIFSALYPPTNLVAAREGEKIVLSWRAPTNFPETFFEIWENNQRIGKTDSSRSDAYRFEIYGADKSRPHSYKVRQVGIELPVSSDFTESNRVSLLTPPAQPSSLQPDSLYIPAGTPVKVSWQHNPIDGTPQSGFELRWRVDAGSWKTETGQKPQQFTLPVFQVGQKLEWQVRTRGEHAGFSPWSSIKTSLAAQPPTVKIVSPTSGATVDKNFCIFKIASSEYPCQLQIETVLTLPEGGSRKQNQNFYVTEDYSFQVGELPNGAKVKISVTAVGKVAAVKPAVCEIVVKYAAPARPVFTAVFDSKTYAQDLTITRPPAGVELATVKNVVYRRSVGGDWVKIVELSPDQENFFDHTVPINTPVEYRIVAISTLGTSAFSETVSCPAPEPFGLLVSWGENYRTVLPIKYNPQLDTSQSFLAEKQYVFAGSGSPSVVRGKATQLVRKIGGTLFPQKDSLPGVLEQVAKLRELAEYPGTVLLRTHDAPPCYGIVTDVSYQLQIWGGYQVSFTHYQSEEK